MEKKCGIRDLKEENRIGYEIRTIHNLIGMHANHHRCKMMSELTPMQAWVIGFLSDRQDLDIYQRDIEEEFNVSRATASNLLQLMEKKGLILRKSVEHDGRLKKIILTEKAIGFHKIAMEDMRMIEELLVQGMSEEEVKQLKRLLVLMHQNVARKIQEDE